MAAVALALAVLGLLDAAAGADGSATTMLWGRVASSAEVSVDAAGRVSTVSSTVPVAVQRQRVGDTVVTTVVPQR
jgi:hypothetical protein